MHAAWELGLFAAQYAVLRFPIKGGKLYLRNINPLFPYHYPGLTGLKTGETDAAGRCYIATAKRHGVSLAAIVLHSPAPANQARKLLDAAFAHVYHQRPLAALETTPDGLDDAAVWGQHVSGAAELVRDHPDRGCPLQ